MTSHPTIFFRSGSCTRSGSERSQPGTRWHGGKIPRISSAPETIQPRFEENGERRRPIHPPSLTSMTDRSGVVYDSCFMILISIVPARLLFEYNGEQDFSLRMRGVKSSDIPGPFEVLPVGRMDMTSLTWEPSAPLVILQRHWPHSSLSNSCSKGSRFVAFLPVRTATMVDPMMEPSKLQLTDRKSNSS
ncbi:unnamed protein product [Nesidiocoris tenuis]|uniref:Uncharacterized protein n=1 Tax=Nesidiocoris tenuis TaxID=355587 RepID=A0A6H5HQE1_9HEMI|nr:unnamed protein product [Nesidiocoris tenuis]